MEETGMESRGRCKMVRLSHARKRPHSALACKENRIKYHRCNLRCFYVFKGFFAFLFKKTSSIAKHEYSKLHGETVLEDASAMIYRFTDFVLSCNRRSVK